MSRASKWIDRGSYFESTAKQNTPEWLEARFGRVNGSDTGALAGKSIFKTPEEKGKIIAGIETESFKPENLEAIDHGHRFEPVCRRWYEKTYRCKILERGSCVSKQDPLIASSVDGEIISQDGLIEIKCPKKMYAPIIKYMEMKKQGWNPGPHFYDHIWETHLAQMMQAMFVLKKSFCDYIVYSTDDSQVFVQRVHFDPVYWSKHYATVKRNYTLYVQPYLPKNYNPVPRCDS